MITTHSVMRELAKSGVLQTGAFIAQISFLLMCSVESIVYMQQLDKFLDASCRGTSQI